MEICSKKGSMKKLLMIFLIFTAASGVFAPKLEAQFHWALDSQFNVQLFSLQAPLGERKEKSITVDGQDYYNGFLIQNNHPNHSNPSNMVPYGVTRGTYTYFSDTLSYFSFGRGIWGGANSLRLTIGYSSDNIAFYTRTYLDRLVRVNEINANEGIGRDDFYAAGSDQSFVAGDGKTPNWSALLRYAFEEWYFRGTAGILTAYVGLTSDRGKVTTFNNQSESLLRGLQVDNYGVIAPTQNADFVHDGLDTNNLLRSGAPATTDVSIAKYTSMPYLMIGLRLENLLPFPLTVQAAADPGNNSGIGSDAGYTRLNGAFRLSGEDIGGHVNFDAIYKIAGGDPVTTNDYDPFNNVIGTLKPSGDRFIVHNWGVYTSILDIAKFDFSLGYSGYFKALEDFAEKESWNVIARTSPLFSGFDLRVRYSGIEKLVITSFNNVSFAKSDTSSAERQVFGVTGTQLPDDTSQDWLALFNALTVVWNPINRLTFSVQLANRYGLINTDITSIDNPSTIERGRQQFGGGAYAAYKFSCFNLQIGFAFRSLIETFTNNGVPPVGSSIQTVGGFRDASGGSLDIAIPIQLTFQF